MLLIVVINFETKFDRKTNVDCIQVVIFITGNWIN